MHRRDFLTRAAAVGAATPLFMPSIARAQSWPTKNIDLLIGQAAGGTTDLVARAIIPGMEKELGVTIVVKNTPGAGSNLAVAQLAASAPDGYTMSTFGVSNFIAPYTTDANFDPWALTPIGIAGEIRYGIGVGRNSPLNSIEDLVALGKQRTVTYSTSAVAGTRGMALLGALTGAKLKWIPTQGGPEAVLQAAGGHVDAVIQAPGDMDPAIASGDLKLLASAGTERWPGHPEVKTLIEQGYDATSISFVGVVCPAGVPDEIQQRLETAFVNSCKLPEVGEAIARFGLLPRGYPGAEMSRLANEAVPDLLKALDEAGMLKKRP